MIPIYTHSFVSKTVSFGLIISICFLVCGIRPAHAQSQDLISRQFVFNTNLSKGMTKYPDIGYLKKVLNNDTRTALANDPCISPFADGYFDQSTKDAVIRFQNLYRNEILGPASTDIATGFVGQYTRAKLNALLSTSAYATILAPNTTSTPGSQNTTWQQAVNQYLTSVNQTVANGVSTSANTQIPYSTSTPTTTSTQTQNQVITSNPSVGAYFNSVQQFFATGVPSATSSTSTTPQQTNPLANQNNQGNQTIVNSYFNTISNTLYGTNGQSNTPNANTSNTNNNPVVTAYLNTVNATVNSVLSGNNPVTSTVISTTNPTSTPSSPLPRILQISPLTPVTCQQTITIIGEHFSPTQNMLAGTLGTFITTANTIATTSTSSVQAITFQLKDFTDYMYNQSVHAGYTKELRFTLMSNGKTSDEIVIMQFTFPGEKRSSQAINETNTQVAAQGMEGMSAYGGTSNPGGITSGQSRNSIQAQKSILKAAEQMEMKVFSNTPQGKLIAAIGGEKAVQTVYGFTPSGHLNQKLQGNTFGAVQSSGGGTGANGGTNGNNNGGSSNSSGLLGVVAGLGAAIGISSLFGGSSAAGAGAAGVSGIPGQTSNGIVGNFGGPIAINFPCTCSANTLLTIQDVRGPSLQLIFQPGVSILYAYGVLRPGAQVLGDYLTSPMQCLVYSGISCTPYGAPIGTIRQIGTSI